MTCRLTIFAALGITLLAGSPASSVSIDWVTVGDPGNVCDPQSQGCFGAVDYEYQIGAYEITNAQYVEFLNAKAASDPLDLYNTNMADIYGGITRSGFSGGFTYSAIAGRENKPVTFVSPYDVFRFANWLNNGQGDGDTETGAYTLLGGTPMPSNGGTIARNASASIFLPSEDEWYKAAYYDAVSASYNAYPFADGFSGVVCESPAGTTTHSANCDDAVDITTDVGAYTTSSSYYGTFDQGGNLSEWNETIIYASSRGIRGGSFLSTLDTCSLAAAHRCSGHPTLQSAGVGFRVATIPEPSTALLVMIGALGLAWRRRGAA